MTALALLELHDAGRIDLNAPVRRYLPWFAISSGKRPILVHQLLSHTAGIPDDYSAEIAYTYDVVALGRAKTLFAPGTAWSPSFYQHYGTGSRHSTRAAIASSGTPGEFQVTRPACR
jgi:CubicO group peptidase (beta-lactamase class C family)